MLGIPQPHLMCLDWISSPATSQEPFCVFENTVYVFCSLYFLYAFIFTSGVAAAQHSCRRSECSSGSIRVKVATHATAAAPARRWSFVSSLPCPKSALWRTYSIPFSIKTRSSVSQPSFCLNHSSHCLHLGHLETNQCASGELASVIISAGVVLSGYMIQDDRLPTLGLGPRRQDDIDDEFLEDWADITKGLSDECCKALWEAVLASCDPDPYPTNAAYHLVQGLSHLGDVYDESWDRVLNEIFKPLVGHFSIDHGDWSAACALVQRVCAHLEKRARVNLSELAKRGSATVAPARDVVLRESRLTFLKMIVTFKHDVYCLYKREQSSDVAIQQRDIMESSDNATQRGQALASREDMPAYTATTELLMEAADFLIEQLPPSREYASNPEKVDFLEWQKRARVFLGSFPPALLAR